jgi:hypothetical protein
MNGAVGVTAENMDSNNGNNNNRHVNTNRSNTMTDSHDEEMSDDGLAPLGGDWGQKENHKNAQNGGKPPSVATVLKNPATYLVDIFDEAVRLLQANEFLDGQRLFVPIVREWRGGERVQTFSDDYARVPPQPHRKPRRCNGLVRFWYVPAILHSQNYSEPGRARKPLAMMISSA